MKILSLHNSNHNPAVEHVFAHEIDPLCCHEPQVLLNQGLSAAQRLSLGARE